MLELRRFENHVPASFDMQTLLKLYNENKGKIPTRTSGLNMGVSGITVILQMTFN